MKPNRIEAALVTMIALIESGMEYPDAHVRAGEKHALVGRQYTLLAEAYDAWCDALDADRQTQRAERNFGC